MIFLMSLQKKILQKLYSFPLFNNIVFVGKTAQATSHRTLLNKHSREQSKGRNATQRKVYKHLTLKHVYRQTNKLYLIYLGALAFYE